MSLTHLDQAGAARMVDVGAKVITAREAVAEASSRAASHGDRRGLIVTS